MPRIFGVTIPDDKKILFSLPYLYGIGPSTAALILKSAGIDPDKRAKELTERSSVKSRKSSSANTRSKEICAKRSLPTRSTTVSWAPGRVPASHAVSRSAAARGPTAAPRGGTFGRRWDPAAQSQLKRLDLNCH